MLYVAYGSNMNLTQMAYRCPNSKRIGLGMLVGWKLVFNCHADIIRTDDINDTVPVVLWDIHKDDWKSLDRYEGYPSYYTRETVHVLTDSNVVVQAIVYVMTEERKGIAMPSSGYYHTILTGYNENGININTLTNALVHAAYNETEYNQYNARGSKKKRNGVI